MNQKTKQTLILCGAAFFAVLFLFSGMMLMRQYADKQESAEAFEQVADLIETVPESFGETEPADSEESTAPEEPAVIPASEKYAAVYEQNPDFIGWLTVPNTNINYPVMFTPNEPNFYLKRNFNKEYSDYGVPYMQENCMVGQSDNLIIYGHHMNDGSMFADLCKYESEKFYQEHKTFTFDTLAEYGEYEIVAVFKTVAYSQEGFKYYHFVDAENEADFAEFMGKCKSLSLYDTGVDAEYGDSLITLSTCEYSRTNGRMVIVAKRITEPPTEAADHAGY